VHRVAQQAQAGRQHQAADQQRQQRVDRRPAGGPHHDAGDNGRHRAQHVAHHMQEGAAHVHVVLAVRQFPGHQQVHGQPDHRHHADQRAVHRLRRLETRPGFDADAEHHGQHRQRIHQRRQQFDASEAETVARRGRPRRDPRRQQRQAQRRAIGHHVAGIGQQRQRTAAPAGDGLDQRVRPGQRQRQQQALALLRRSGRGMTVMMFVRSGVHSLRLLVVRKKQAADVSCRRPPRTGFTDQPT
jgi:hypothetical protein